MKKILSVCSLLLLFYQVTYSQYLYTTPVTGWSSTTITYLDIQNVVAAGFDDGIKAAANTWNSDCGVTIEYNSSSPNIIGASGYGGPDASNSDTYMVSKTALDNYGNISSASMIINTNSSISWSTNVNQTTLQEGYTDVWSLALHEFGHWLGLADNTTSSSIMDASNIVLASETSPYTPDRTPSSDDISNVTNLYFPTVTINNDITQSEVWYGNVTVAQSIHITNDATVTQAGACTLTLDPNVQLSIDAGSQLIIRGTVNQGPGSNIVKNGGILTGIGGTNPPPAPLNFTASIVGQNIILNWSDPSPYIGYFKIYKNTALKAEPTTTTYTDVNAVSSLPVTYIVGAYAPNNGAGVAGETDSQPIKVVSAPATISSTTSWSGTVYVNSSVTINYPGGSLYIAPGTNVVFNSGNNYTLTANGELTVQGEAGWPVTFTSNSSSPSAGNWGKIILNGSGANNSTLSFTNISYGNEIDVTGASNVTIQNCNIENNSGNGIYLYSSPNCQMQYNTIANSNANHGIYIYGGSNENCYNNVIYKTNHNKQGAGIFYYGSSGTVGQNDIDYFDWGIQALWGASPSAEISSSITYNNRITNCQNGLMVYGNSYCNFGVLTSYPSGGLNSIYNNGYNAAVGDYYVTFPSGLYAECDWWGSNPPPSRFYIGSESYLYWTYPESADPWSKYPLPSIQDKGSVKGEIAASVASTSTQTSTQSTEAADPSSSDSLLAGIGLRQEGKFEEARDFFKSYLNNHPDDQAAYVYLYSCADSETAPSLIQYFNALPKQAAKEQKMLLSYLYLRQGDSKSAKQVNDGIISANPNTILAAKAKLDNFYIALYNDNDLNNAAVILKDVERSAGLFASTGSSTTPMEISDAEHALAVYVDPQTGEMPNINTEQSKNESAVTTSSSAQSGLMANYPNPFNPSTNISYNLPTSGHVTLKVYDVLGREVKTLVNEDQALGTYSVRFDASRLASGVYLYRLTAPGIMVTKKMVVTK